jgi:hypothetical protein
MPVEHAFPDSAAKNAREGEFETEKMSLSMGPSHPSTHGVLRLQMELDGEIVTKADPVIGYLHRGDEKIAENMTYNQFVPYTDRLDYLAPLANNMAYAIAVEKAGEAGGAAALPGDPRHHGGNGADFGPPDGPRRLRDRCRGVDGLPLLVHGAREALQALRGADGGPLHDELHADRRRRSRRARGLDGPGDAFCDQFLPILEET